jgi:type I restriction enzyme, S subunit
MSEWKECKLGELVELITKGTTPSTMGGRFVTNGINFIKSESVSYDGRIDTSKFVSIDFGTHQKLKRSQLVKDDILFSMAGIFLGKNAIVTEDLLPANTNQALAIIRLNKEKALPKFINYYLRQPSVIDFVNNMSGQSAQPNINFEEIKSIEILLPQISEQKAIATVLSSIDDKIDLLHRQNATLEAMAETLFRQWFVEEAKEDWETVSLADIAFFFNGKSRPNEEGTIPIYGGNGILGYTNKSNYSGKSIIIGRVGAYCGSLYYENKEIWVSDNALLVKAKNERQTHYLFFLLKTLDLNSMAEGSSHPLLTQTLLKSIEVSQPPKDKIEEFDGQFESWRNKIELNQTQIRTLTTLRDTLLPKLMSGEVRVKM